MNQTCDLLNVTKILEENASRKRIYSSMIHFCLEQGWNVNNSNEIIHFNLIWDKIYKLHLNKLVKNDCGEFIGFNSSIGYGELDKLLRDMKSSTTDNICAAKCPFKSQNTTYDAVRKLCPTCLECISRPGETDTHRGCSTNRVCAGYGCFKQVQSAENGTYNETMMMNVIKSLSPSYLDNLDSLELLTTLLSAVTFFVLIFYLRPSRELSHANIWITFILLVLILMMRWDIVRTTLLPNYCWLACPVEMILCFIMCFISIQQYWKDNLPALNFNNVLCTCLGVILNGIIVTFIHQTDLTQSCNGLKSLNASSKNLQCGELERIKQSYFYSIIVLIVILAFYKMITMKEKMKWEMALWFALMMIMIILNLFRISAMISGFVTIWWKIYEAIMKKKDSKAVVQTLNTQMNSDQTIIIETEV